jgi:NADPH2:quinone reductase
MKAVQISSYGDYDQLQLVDLPQPVPEAGQVLVRMTVAAINPLDHHTRLGIIPWARKLPIILGSEGVGVIASEGSDLQMGTVVMFQHAYFLPRGGTWQEYVLAPRSSVVPLPDGVNYMEAAALRTAYDTAYTGLIYHGHLQPGQVVFAPGVGSSVGNAVIQLGKILGAAHVITTAGSNAKAERARELGYENVIDLTQESIRDGIARLTEKNGVDLAIDCLGGDITAQSLEVLKPGGTLVLMGTSAGRQSHVNLLAIISKSLKIVGHMTAFGPPEVMDEAFHAYFKLWTEGQIQPLIDRTFPFEQEVEAQRYQVESRPFGKVLLTFG